MNPRILAPLALVALLVPTALRAASFCAGTPAELQAALSAAAVNGESDLIKVEPGVYAAPGGAAFHYDGALEDHDLVLSGGWRTIGIPPNVFPCFLRIRIDPRQTKITGGTTDGNLRIWAGAGAVSIDGFMISNGHSLGTQAAGGAYVFTEGDVTIDHNLFIGNEGHFAGGIQVYTTQTLHFVNNLLLGNTSQLVNGAADLSGAHGWITHNGFMANSGPEPAVEVFGNSTSSFVLTSNLFWDNQGDDLDFAIGPNYPAPILVNNLVETLSLIVGDIHPASVNNIDSDPQFSVAGDCDRELGWELGDGSPAIDAAALNPPFGMPAWDLLGRDRVVGAAADIGPLERRVAFCDGVESGDVSAWSAAQQ